MAKINLLDSSIYNRIAAGEVVDRPYSVVKEFVENSIDAGAKKISIAIERGGKDRICVSDDGCGIESDDLYSAFLPHATSKIEKVEDLDLIKTLGFRGEALASIASVAKVKIRSKFETDDSAYEIDCVGGKIGERIPCALGKGTEITAENLFYNTPVRAKFLKTDKGEESEITNFVSRFILGNPYVAFNYLIDGKTALQSFGGGLDEAIAAVYGASVIERCYHIDGVKHGIRIYGYIGKPDYTKANRTYQSVFVNGRYVVNGTISSAVGNAYASYLMKRQYPFYVLFIDVPPEIVDVNVHPNKADVRFENNQVIYGCIYSVVSSVLDGNAAALEFVVDAKHEREKGVLHASSSGQTTVSEAEKTVESPIFPDFNEVMSKDIGDMCLRPLMEKNFSSGESVCGSEPFRYPKQSEMRGGARIEFHDSGVSERSEGSRSATDIFAENKKFLEDLERKEKQQKIIFERAEYRGCLFNTYLIYEEGENVYIIDQHAAHERLIFNRLKEEMETRKIIKQPMLIPYVLSLNSEEFRFISENLKYLEDIGFDIEEFGAGSFKISAVPLDLQEIDLQGFFDELLQGVDSLKAVRLSELLRDKIAMAACKHAVKGGMILSDLEKAKLFEMLHGNMGLKCPHGRPIAIKLSKYEVEKMFKRIV